MNIYVGNLSFETTKQSLEATFTQYGEVTSARVITDRMTGRSRGFGFVEMGDKAQGDAAISALNGKDLDGRELTVNEARPKEDNRDGGGRSSGPRW